jgi:calcineurin-like phosphoesterase family protein
MTLKAKWQQRETWFTAGHNLDGEDVDAAAVLEPYNARVEPDDLVWHLGNLRAPGTVRSHLDETAAVEMLGRITVIAGPGDDYFAGTGADFEKRAEMLDHAVPQVERIITGRGFRKSRMAIQVPLGFGFSPVLLWSLPYTGAIETAQWRPPIPSKSERLWILHGQPSPVGEPVDPRNRQISVHRDCWDGRPVSIDDIRETIRGQF